MSIILFGVHKAVVACIDMVNALQRSGDLSHLKFLKKEAIIFKAGSKSSIQHQASSIKYPASSIQKRDER
ncbi:MAG: hypothetical protein COS84_07145 [Armatimonadetes bacterium CG07_land_8_20_14_0_80_40_9]|nr:MAG: hypothetical protein COS84_07145 [Armatimonadetes bacterium CG07_land_8_20_14_0_80_40_9]